MSNLSNGPSLDRFPNGSTVNLGSQPDKDISKNIIRTNVHAAESFDEDSLFIIVENIINLANLIINNFTQGGNDHGENIEEIKAPKAGFKAPKAGFKAPSLCTMKSISTELSCKEPGAEIAKKTAVSILEKLSSYKWEARAVLTLAAFTYDFWDFWHFAHLSQSDPLAKHYGFLKHVPKLIRAGKLEQQYRQSILELNGLIKMVVDAVGIIDELEKFYDCYHDIKKDPEWPTAQYNLPDDVHWIIVIIAAIATKISILISYEPEKRHDLKPYDQQMHSILSKLEQHRNICRLHQEVEEAIRNIRNLLRTPTEVMEIIKALIFTKDTVQYFIVDGSTNQTAKLEVLKGQNLFLYFSTDITSEDIELLAPLYERAKREESYTVVWVLVVKQWTGELQKKFDDLQPRISWHIVKQISPAGIRFIKEEWQFMGKPTLVLINSQGTVENTNAIYMLKGFGLRAFPFDNKVKEEILKIDNIASAISYIVGDSTLQRWINEEKYIIFYGGEDHNLIQQLKGKFSAFGSDDDPFKGMKISIEIFCVGGTATGGVDIDITGRFWNSLQSWFASKSKEVFNPLIEDIKVLLSYKNSAWAVVSKGSKVITTGDASNIIKVIEKVDEWKHDVETKGFHAAFKDHHSKIIKSEQKCCHIDIHYDVGYLPKTINCSVCSLTMETFITYKCCHKIGPNAAHH